MKGFIYKTPTISAFIINMFLLSINIYLIKSANIIFVLFLAFLGIFNRNIIVNSNYISIKNKAIVYGSFFFTLVITIIYTINYYKIII